MERLSFERGRVVQSLQGRDEGRYFIVLAAGEEGYVMMADGLTHKLENPKKKKTKHLHAKPVLIDLDAVRPEGGPLQNSDLKRALKENGFAPERPLCKEG